MQIITKSLLLILILSFIGVVFVEAAGTTLRGNELTYDGLGILDNLQNITLNNNTLLIIDSIEGVKAFFNVPKGQALDITSQEMIDIAESNTTSGFRGDVINIDNTDNQSRFIEINLNNGTNASAGFVAQNNEGHQVTFGIGSGNFSFGGVDFFNEGAILNRGPEKFNFANVLVKGWDWRSNVSGTFIESMQLDGLGNLNILGNFSVNNSIAFEQVDSSDNITGFVKMFCKDTNKCFITRDDGTERRLLDAGGGSILIDEVWNFMVEPIFESGINLSNSSNLSLYGGKYLWY